MAHKQRYSTPLPFQLEKAIDLWITAQYYQRTRRAWSSLLYSLDGVDEAAENLFKALGEVEKEHNNLVAAGAEDGWHPVDKPSLPSYQSSKTHRTVIDPNTSRGRKVRLPTLRDLFTPLEQVAMLIGCEIPSTADLRTIARRAPAIARLEMNLGNWTAGASREWTALNDGQPALVPDGFLPARQPRKKGGAPAGKRDRLLVQIAAAALIWEWRDDGEQATAAKIHNAIVDRAAGRGVNLPRSVTAVRRYGSGEPETAFRRNVVTVLSWVRSHADRDVVCPPARMPAKIEWEIRDHRHEKRS